MTKEEIRAKFQPRQLDSQFEFDRVMNEINVEQTHASRPFIDLEQTLRIQKEEYKAQIDRIRLDIIELNKQLIKLEMERKEINREFHYIKHELIMLNPKEGWEKEEVQ